MKLTVLFSGLCLCLTLAAPAHAVKLRYVVKAGKGWTTATTMKAEGTIEVMGMNLPLGFQATSTTSYGVTEVKPDGALVAVLTYQLGEQKVTVAGMEVPAMPKPAVNPLTVTHSSLGKVLKIDGVVPQRSESIELGKIFSTLFIPMPEREVQVGESWELRPEGALVPATWKCKLVALLNENGREVAKIECSSHVSGEAMQLISRDLAKEETDFEISGPGVTMTMMALVDVATGVPLRASGTMEADLKVKVNGVMVRQVLTGTIEETAKVN